MGGPSGRRRFLWQSRRKAPRNAPLTSFAALRVRVVLAHVRRARFAILDCTTYERFGLWLVVASLCERYRDCRRLAVLVCRRRRHHFSDGISQATDWPRRTKRR